MGLNAQSPRLGPACAQAPQQAGSHILDTREGTFELAVQIDAFWANSKLLETVDHQVTVSKHSCRMVYSESE